MSSCVVTERLADYPNTHTSGWMKPSRCGLALTADETKLSMSVRPTPVALRRVSAGCCSAPVPRCAHLRHSVTMTALSLPSDVGRLVEVCPSSLGLCPLAGQSTLS